MTNYLKFLKIILLICFFNAVTPVRYDDVKLLRIKNIPVSDIKSFKHDLQSIYNGMIWTWTANSIDVSINYKHMGLLKAKTNELKYDVEVMMSDVQKSIDAESYPRELSARASTTSSSVMNWKNYCAFDVIDEFITNLANKYPKLCKVIEIGKSYEGRQLRVLRITNNPNGNPAVWIDGGIHAREWISPASVTYFMNYLLENWESNPTYMRSISWYILPVLNPDGYEYSRNINRLWRKNRRLHSGCDGVDLNRNWDVDWYNSGTQSDDYCDETYRGAEPFSEPETAAVAKFVKSIINLKGFLTFHSYGQYVLYPFGFQYAAAKDSNKLLNEGNKAAINMRQIAGTTYTVGQSKILGYISGASDDWAKSKISSVTYAYTIELRDRGQFGFLLPPMYIESTAKEAVELVKVVANAISVDRMG